MPSASSNAFALRLESLEDRMLLAADIDWLHDAVTPSGTDFTADLLWLDTSHTATKLVLHGTSAHGGAITVDTSHLDVLVTQIAVSSFDQVTINGAHALQGATVIDVGHLVVNAPLKGFLQATNVSSIDFRDVRPPAEIDVLSGDWVQIKAPQFNGIWVFSLSTKVLDLLSDKASDTVNVICSNLNDAPVIRTTFLPEHCIMSVDADHVLYYPNGIQNDQVPLHNATVGSVPFDQVYKLLADLLARAGVDSADSILGAFTKAAALPPSAAQAAVHHVATVDPMPTVVHDLPIDAIHLPAVFSTNLLPLEHHDLGLAANFGGNHVPTADSHAAALALTQSVHNTPVEAARAAGAVTALPSLTNPLGWVTATMFEPIRGLRNFVMQRITQEFTPGERPALLEEPRASKPTAKQDRESGR